MQIILTGISQGLGKALFDILKIENNIKITALSRRFLDEQIDYAKSNKNINLHTIDLSNLEEINNILKLINFDDNIIFINNAAKINPIDDIENISEKDFLSAINLNFITPMLIIKAIANKKLFILNISTGAARKAIDKWYLYCSTKSALEMFLKVAELKDNIEIINYDPGVMDTQMQSQIRCSDFGEVDYFKSLKTELKLKKPEDVAEKIFNLYLKKRL